MYDIPCVIFAGGKSSRMGEDKALLPFGEFDTLTQFQLHRLSKLFKNVYISCRNRSKFHFDANFIEDIQTKNIYAPTAGFIAIFENLACEKFFAISVDTPFITEDVMKAIIDAEKQNPYADAVVAKTATAIHPMCGIYHQSLKDEFKKMLKDDNHKLGLLLKNVNTTFVEFEDEKPFLNINHPHEYQSAILLHK
jgi:molybdenum cofactor guanylyltransferase